MFDTIILRGQGVLRCLTLKIEFLEFLDTREPELPASFYSIENIVFSQSYVMLGSHLYFQYARKFQSQLLKN